METISKLNQHVLNNQFRKIYHVFSALIIQDVLLSIVLQLMEYFNKPLLNLCTCSIKMPACICYLFLNVMQLFVGGNRNVQGLIYFIRVTNYSFSSSRIITIFQQKRNVTSSSELYNKYHTRSMDMAFMCHIFSLIF